MKKSLVDIVVAVLAAVIAALIFGTFNRVPR
jgi:FlaG/FlaF family flagellin (archaellin)